MQKSKKITIVIIIIILFYGLLSSFKLVNEMNRIYLYYINPLFWIILAVFLKINISDVYKNAKIKKEIIYYVVICSIMYVIINVVAGLFLTFGNNPYFTSVKGIIINLWIFGTIIIAKEYIRYKLINNVYEKEKIIIAILISTVYVIIDMELNTYLSQKITTLFITKKICQSIIPLIVKNALYSYISINSDYIPVLIYEMIIQMYLWCSPILPNAPWVMTAIIDSTIPIIIFLYARYVVCKYSNIKSKKEMDDIAPSHVVPLLVMVILAIWFAVGIFPIKPVAIASASMEKELYTGDVAIIKKCNANDVSVGDIIEYQMDGYTVIHRIIEKKQKNGQYYFVTKGDNNNAEDAKDVSESQLIGKVIFKIKYLGYPSVLLNKLQAKEQIEVDTGKEY